MKTKDFDFIRVEDGLAQREVPAQVFTAGRIKTDVLLEGLLHQAADELVFRMKFSPSTRREYLFEFDLDVSYQLEGLRLKIGCSVRNCGLKGMPFSIGAHPGFNLPASHKECFLEFKHTEVLHARLLGKDLLMSDKSIRILNGGKVVPLGRTLFSRCALTLMDLKSLCCRSSSRCVTVEFSDFRISGFGRTQQPRIFSLNRDSVAQIRSNSTDRFLINREYKPCRRAAEHGL